jgi:peroxiredoxin
MHDRSRFRALMIWFLIGSSATLHSVRVRADEASPVGRPLADFALQDYRSREYQLADFQQHEVLVIAFLGTECPLAKLYGPRLARLAKEFEPRGVAFIGMNANSQDAITEIAAYARLHEIPFPILKDVGHRVADQLGAQRTPEVFVIDRQREVRYWGRIDDQYGVGYVRQEPQQHDLRRALEEVLAGQAVSTPIAAAPGCFIGRVRRQQPQTEVAIPVTYSDQIVRILQQHCLECHRDGDIAPFALDEYDEVVGWAETIAEVVRDGRMPPWHADPQHGRFRNDRHLSDEQKELIYQWVASGAPQGDPSKLPPAPEFPSGWQLPREPDLVVAMSDRPVPVPAEGAVEYQYFRVDPGLTEDKWIEAVEVVPGNRAVVHHILVFDESAEGQRRDFGGGVRGFLAGYVPGMRAEPYPPGMAKLLTAGSQLIFQMHYTPIGSEQADLSKIGFRFASPDEVTHEVKTISAFQPNLRIPAGADNHEVSSKTRLNHSVQMLALMPHMHLRGKSFRYLLRRPDHDQWITLLDVPNYDFNWQTNYLLADPLELPAGSYVKCVAHYDNSAENLNNPNPGETVQWGEQTWNEMMIGYFDVAVPLESEGKIRVDLFGPNWRAEEFILQMDANDDFALQPSELPLRMRLMGLRADEDQDGKISPEELRKAFEGR